MTGVDITQQMLGFKEASRHAWNSMLHAGIPASIPMIETFEQIERDLLREWVLRGVGDADAAEGYRLGPMHSIVVQANTTLTEIPVQYADPGEPSFVRWSEPMVIPVTKLPRLGFFDFFDWNPYTHRDFAFVRAYDRDTNQGVLLSSRDVMFLYNPVE